MCQLEVPHCSHDGEVNLYISSNWWRLDEACAILLIKVQQVELRNGGGLMDYIDVGGLFITSSAMWLDGNHKTSIIASE